MAGNGPWSVNDVDPQAREAAKIAARRAGRTIGQGISRTIRATAAVRRSTVAIFLAHPTGTEPVAPGTPRLFAPAR